MDVTKSDIEIIKLILKKLESVEIMVNVALSPNGKKEVRAYTPTGIRVGNTTAVMSETDDLLGASITSLLTIDVNKLIRNQNEQT